MLGAHCAACRSVTMSALGSRCSASKMLGLHRDRSGSARASAPGIGAWDMRPVSTTYSLLADDPLQPFRAGRVLPPHHFTWKELPCLPESPDCAVTTAAVLTAGLTATTAPLSGPAPATAAPPGTGWVTGVVVDRSGDPVEGALVNVLPPREIPEFGMLDETTDRWDVTGADGTFRVRQHQRRLPGPGLRRRPGPDRDLRPAAGVRLPHPVRRTGRRVRQLAPAHRPVRRHRDRPRCRQHRGAADSPDQGHAWTAPGSRRSR